MAQDQPPFAERGGEGANPDDASDMTSRDSVDPETELADDAAIDAYFETLRLSLIGAQPDQAARERIAQTLDQMARYMRESRRRDGDG